MTRSIRRIAVFSGDRSERGHVDAILAGIAADSRLTGTLIAAPLAHHDDHPASVATAVGLHVQDMTQKLVAAEPDVLVIYGDRSEAFAAAIAATYLRIPIAHVEGGDITMGGCPDDVVRHAISALASIHFATNRESADALRRSHGNVHDVGLPILDLANERARPEEVRDWFGLDADRPLVLFCMHPVPYESIGEPVVAVSQIMKNLRAQVVCLTPNADAGSGLARQMLEEHFVITPNMPYRMFHGLLAIADCFAGNSSAALKEAPYFRCLAVDIGKRQRGRLHGPNLIHVEPDLDAVYQAVKHCITFAAERRSSSIDWFSPYGSGNAGKRIADVLATVALGGIK